MEHKATATATIRESATAPEIALNLTLDADSMYRWHQATDGADTDISGHTIQSAIESGSDAWRGWEFAVSPGAAIRGDVLRAAADYGIDMDAAEAMAIAEQLASQED